MHGITLRRLLLVATLAGALGVGTQVNAFAGTPRKHAAAVADKKKKKKPTVKVVTNDTLGEIVVDGKGNTLYAFDPDGTNTDASQCTDGCAAAWPPLEAKKLKAGKGIDATQLAVNDSGQVSYNGHLLYHYSGDSAPGDTNGQGVGGVWHAMGGDGNPTA